MIELLKETFEIPLYGTSYHSTTVFTFDNFGEVNIYSGPYCNESISINYIAYFENSNKYCLTCSLILRYFDEFSEAIDIFLRKVLASYPQLKSKVTVYKSIIHYRPSIFINNFSGPSLFNFFVVSRPCDRFGFMKYDYCLGDKVLFSDMFIRNEDIPFILENIERQNEFLVRVSYHGDKLSIKDYVSGVYIFVSKENIVLNEQLKYSLNGEERYCKSGNNDITACVMPEGKRLLHNILEKWTEDDL